jgi:glycosyltransferase involved in cell wall biosynthesis
MRLLKIAIIHDWLSVYAGAEKVLEQLLKLYPQADIFTIVDFLPEKDRSFLEGHKITTSFIQKLPYAKTKYRNYLPLMLIAIEQFDLSSYDLIISDSHAVAKGVITGPDQTHISYIHSPIRYAWDFQHQYLQESGLQTGLKGTIARYLLHKTRIWDSRTANGVDYMLANSNYIARRIWKVYRRESQVIFPPVDVESFTLCETKEDFYLTASRMVPYKKIDIIIEAFSMMADKKLIVIGDGPDFEKIKAKAGSNITLMGYQSFEVLKNHMQRAKAFVFAAEEDFGITPVEAMACGTPVIAFGKGGILDTVIDGRTGVFFDTQSIESLCEAVKRFETMTFDTGKVSMHARKFSEERFLTEMKLFIQEKLEK